MTTGFTPIQVQAAETPSTDEVLRAVKDAAHMLRRAAASSPSRPHQVQLHHRASERESLARQMQDIKAGGQRVFGEDCDSPVNRRVTRKAALDDLEIARMLIPEDHRPEPFQPKLRAQPALCTVVQLDPEIRFVEPSVPSGGDTPGRVLASTPSTQSLGTKVPSHLIP